MNRAYSRAGIIARLFNTPLAVNPQTAAVVLGAIGDRFDVSQLFVPAVQNSLALSELEEMASDERTRLRAHGGIDRIAKLHPAERLMMVHDHVAHVVIRGELVAENGSIGPDSGFTGYDGIVAAVQSADADPNVKGILLDMDSPGGEVSGLYECAQILMARRGNKPMRAVIRGMGCSAAYSIAACADPGQVTLHDLGFAGSNGIITMHADFSGALQQDGIKVTLFTAGDHKADGNPFEPLPEHVARDIQASVEIAYSRLVAHVASARGISEDDVRAQQAQIYRGQAAIKAGLVDKIMSWQDSMDEFEAIVNGRKSGQSAPSGARSARKDNAMSTEATAPAAEVQPGITQEAHDQALATATSEATAAAEASERQRIADLIELDANSSVSDSLAAAIADGTSTDDFAINQAKSAKTKLAAAADAAKNEAVPAAKLPEGSSAPRGSGTAEKQNRGEAVVERMRGKHVGLPQKA